MWSFGCILFELFTGIPLFQGENEDEQLALMITYLGYPTYSFLSKVRKKEKSFNRDKRDLKEKPLHKSLQSQMKNAPESLIDLIKVNIYKYK